MSAAVRTVIAAPLYNRAAFLSETLESLLCQTDRDFALLLLDDCSDDETPAVAGRYAELDPRISYRRTPSRLGLAAAWREAFRWAGESHPEAPYFAWGSDHDLWHPRWLETMVAALESSPQSVLAYPRNLRISESGAPIREPASFDTAGIDAPPERLLATQAGGSKGDMVYGLARVDALRRTDLIADVVYPDRLLVCELALHGQLVQVPQILWYRRFRKPVTPAAQRSALFARRPPASAYVPWWLAHAALLGWSCLIHGRWAVGRSAAPALASAYLRSAMGTAWEGRRRQLRRARRKARQGYLGLRRWVGAVVHPLSMLRSRLPGAHRDRSG